MIKSEADIVDNSYFKKWMNADGHIDYLGILSDSNLKGRIEEYSAINIDAYSKHERLAFFLNAYNLFIVYNIALKLKKNPEWAGNLSLFQRISFFYLKKHKIAGQKISLYKLEKDIRKKFKDPRIHFAINCGSIGCPVIPDGLFVAETLEETLEALTYSFINNDHDVHLSTKDDSHHLVLNLIFKWYLKDFDGEKGLRLFLSRYWHKAKDVDLSTIRISYSKYDWSVNKT